MTYDDVAKSFTIMGSDLSWDGTYTIAIVALDIAGTDTGGFFTFDLIVVDPCDTASLDLDAAMSIFIDPALTYFIGDPASSISWADTDVTESLPGICGPLVYAIQEVGGSLIDAIFDDSIDPHSLYVETSDPAKAQTWNLQIVTSYANYPAITDTDTFSIQVISCFVPSATTATTIADQNYSLGDSALTTSAFTDFTIVPSVCTVTYAV